MKGVILAGGNSKRMGRDKALIRVNNETLIGHVYTSIKTQVNEVVISGLQDYGLGVPVISDDPKGPKGPVGALFAIWSSRAADLSPGFFTVPVDAPRLPKDLCQRLYGDRSAIAVTPGRTHQTFAWWLYEDLKFLFEQDALETSISLKHVAEICNARHVLWTDETLFYNINTPNDLSRYLTDIAPSI